MKRSNILTLHDKLTNWDQSESQRVPCASIEDHVLSALEQTQKALRWEEFNVVTNNKDQPHPLFCFSGCWPIKIYDSSVHVSGPTVSFFQKIYPLTHLQSQKSNLSQGELGKNNTVIRKKLFQCSLRSAIAKEQSISLHFYVPSPIWGLQRHTLHQVVWSLMQAMHSHYSTNSTHWEETQFFSINSSSFPQADIITTAILVELCSDNRSDVRSRSSERTGKDQNCVQCTALLNQCYSQLWLLY